MKKLFLLISVLTLSIAVNATTININAETADALRLALNSANDGDEIVMAAGTYVESNSNYIAFNAKNVIVKAVDGANVIIKPHVPFTISGGARAEIKGVKIDASELCSVGSYSHLMYPSDGADNNRLILDGCEIYGYTEGKAVIASRSSNKLDSLIINNCKFYNHTTRSCVFLENTENKGLIVTNSTFYNIATGTEDFGAGVIDDRSNTAKVRVDHCTFYNVEAKNTDFAAIGKIKTSDAIVSNCIFVMPTSTADLRAIRDVAQANNCLTYNYTKDSGQGIHGDVTQNNSIFADPLFTNAASGDFSYAGNWSTGSISPARGAATDGSDLGDPKWYSAETLPTTSFASDYVFLGTKAQLSGSFALNGDNYIQSQDKTFAGIAKWKIHAERQCIVEVTLNIAAANTSGHRYEVAIYDADNVLVGTALAEPENSWSHGDKVLGTYSIPAAGDYTVKLTNDCNNSSTIIEGVTFAYLGGAVQNISTSTNTTLNVADAWFTSGATRAEGQISYSSWNSEDSWVKWNIAAAGTKFYDLTLNFSSTNGHSMAVNIYEDEEASPVATVSESFKETTGSLTLTDRVNLVGGKNYIVKVTNPISGSAAKVTSVVFAPVVASATALPNTLDFSNAVLSEKANITDGMLYFNEPGADKDPRGQWAQWEVTTNHNGLFLFTMGVTSTNEQSYKITILDNLDNVLDYYESSPGSGDKTLTHYFALNTGSYFVKVENTRSFSKGHLTSFVVTEPAGVVVLDEEATSNESWVGNITAETIHDVQIKRTIKAGMYNTFCLPFEVTSSQCKDIFGSDVQLLNLYEATVDENSVLTLDFSTASDIYPGTPVLIQTSRDIVNPVFTGVKFIRETPSATTKTNANFTGTFVKTALEPDVNILFLGANNKLFFPTASVDMYGMRGWFVILGSGGGAAPAVRSARIVENGQVATEIELVKEQPSGIGQKILENGQLIIIRDGVRYNAMGVKLQ